MADIKLDGSIAEFHISEIGKHSGESFSGDFIVKCYLNPIEVIKQDKLYRELMGAVNPHLASSEAQNFCFALSQLKFRIIKSPAGWKNTDIDGGHLDANIVIKVLDIAIDAQMKYRDRSADRLKTLQNKLTDQIKEGVIASDEEIVQGDVDE